MERKSEGVMDDESGGDDRDELTNEWGESRRDCEADGMNPGVDSRDGVMHIWMSDLWFEWMDEWMNECEWNSHIQKVHTTEHQIARSSIKLHKFLMLKIQNIPVYL